MLTLSRVAVLLATLAACSDDGRDASSTIASSTGPNLTVCADCPVGVAGVCPEGQVCASILPGSGGQCMLACDEGDPEPCIYEGVASGTCKKFSPDNVTACNDPDNGPVCPPSK